MVCKSAKNLSSLFSCLVFLGLMFGFVTSDVNQDKAECTDKLIGLANCLPFVSGQSKTPTIDCCTGVKDVVTRSKRCLCILIKDHDDPNLGFNINVTLALKLPGDCKSPTNITQCIDLLHLSPKSHEAVIFEEFEKSLEKNSTSATPVPAASNATGKGTNTTEDSQDKSGSKEGRVFYGISLFGLASYFFMV